MRVSYLNLMRIFPREPWLLKSSHTVLILTHTCVCAPWGRVTAWCCFGFILNSEKGKCFYSNTQIFLLSTGMPLHIRVVLDTLKKWFVASFLRLFPRELLLSLLSLKDSSLRFTVDLSSICLSVIHLHSRE